MNNALRIFAAAAAFSLAASAIPAHAAPAPQDQEHRDGDRQGSYAESHPNYSNNSYYQLGNREGYQDYGKKQQRKEHRHKYRSDDDRAAHDYGYQQGWSGQRYNSNDRHMNDNRDPH